MVRREHSNFDRVHYVDSLNLIVTSDVLRHFMCLQVEYVSSNADAGRLLQKTLNEYR